jgi:hypothetical protein
MNADEVGIGIFKQSKEQHKKNTSEQKKFSINK